MGYYMLIVYENDHEYGTHEIIMSSDKNTPEEAVLEVLDRVDYKKVNEIRVLSEVKFFPPKVMVEFMKKKGLKKPRLEAGGWYDKTESDALFALHYKKIMIRNAKKTLKLKDGEFLEIGGMSKEEARKILVKFNIKFKEK